MCAYPPSSEQPQQHRSEFQLPSLGGIYIPSMKGAMLKRSLSNWQDAHRQARPTLQRIDTGIATPRLPYAGELNALEQNHLAIDPPDDFLSYLLEPGSINNTYIPPTPLSGDQRDFETPHRRLMLSPLSGPYISNSGRENLSASSLNIHIHSPQTPSPILKSPNAIIHEDDIDVDEEMDPEDAWNLVPYNIPWGPSYHGYKSGSLPGPDGKCIFLRSPTPLKNQRTGQACEKCRERKAKCSGSKPSCARCIARGHICEYGPELKRPRPDSSKSDSEDEEPESPHECTTSLQTSPVTTKAIARRDRRNTDSGPQASVTNPVSPKARRHTVIAVPQVSFPSAGYSQTFPKRDASRKRCETDGKVARPDINLFLPERRLSRGNNPSTPSPFPEAFDFSDFDYSRQFMPPYTPVDNSYNDPLPSLSQFRFPSLQDTPSSENNGPIDLDMDQLHTFADFPSQAQPLHSPNPLRQSPSLTRLSHAYQTPPPDDGDSLYYLNNGTPDGYSTGTASSDGHEFDYDIASLSPRVMQPLALWQNDAVLHKPYVYTTEPSQSSSCSFTMEDDSRTLFGTTENSAIFGLLDPIEIQQPSMSSINRYAATEWQTTEEQIAMVVDHNDIKTPHSPQSSF